MNEKWQFRILVFAICFVTVAIFINVAAQHRKSPQQRGADALNRLIGIRHVGNGSSPEHFEHLY